MNGIFNIAAVSLKSVGTCSVLTTFCLFICCTKYIISLLLKMPSQKDDNNVFDENCFVYHALHLLERQAQKF